jgi:hypothetical protein
LDLRDLILLYIITTIIEQDEIITNYYPTIDQLQYAGKHSKNQNNIKTSSAGILLWEYKDKITVVRD